MTIGYNRTVKAGDRQLHLQIEDLGSVHGAFEARIYEGGQVLFHKRVPHPPPLDGSPEERRQQLKAAAEHLFLTLTEAIHRGKIAAPGATAE